MMAKMSKMSEMSLQVQMAEPARVEILNLPILTSLNPIQKI